eukprot:jgi/Mesvir1/6486/Mv16758-RA.1
MKSLWVSESAEGVPDASADAEPAADGDEAEGAAESGPSAVEEEEAMAAQEEGVEGVEQEAGDEAGVLPQGEVEESGQGKGHEEGGGWQGRRPGLPRAKRGVQRLTRRLQRRPARWRKGRSVAAHGMTAVWRRALSVSECERAGEEVAGGMPGGQRGEDEGSGDVVVDAVAADEVREEDDDAEGMAREEAQEPEDVGEEEGVPDASGNVASAVDEEATPAVDEQVSDGDVGEGEEAGAPNATPVDMGAAATPADTDADGEDSGWGTLEEEATSGVDAGGSSTADSPAAASRRASGGGGGARKGRGPAARGGGGDANDEDLDWGEWE